MVLPKEMGENTATMKLDPVEQKDGMAWFMGAGLLALLLALFLFKADEMLTHSSSEVDLGKTLRELRLAQTSLDSRASDWRQAGPPHSAPSTVEAEDHNSHSAHD